VQADPPVVGTEEMGARVSTTSEKSTKPQGNRSAPLQEQLTTQLSQASDIAVSLDGLVFEDGTFIGSNDMFFQQLQAMVNAKVDLFRELAAGADKGNIDQAIESIEAASQAPDITFSEQFLPDEYYKYFRKLYATEISGMIRSFGKIRAVPHFLNSYHRARPVLRK